MVFYLFIYLSDIIKIVCLVIEDFFKKNFLLLLFLFFRINMYSEGLMDLMEMLMVLPFNPDPTAKLEEIEKKAKERYFPVFEKVEKQNKMSC